MADWADHYLLKVTGEQELAQLNAQLNAVNVQLAQGPAAQAQYGQAAADLASDIAAVAARVEAAERAMADFHRVGETSVEVIGTYGVATSDLGRGLTDFAARASTAEHAMERFGRAAGSGVGILQKLQSGMFWFQVGQIFEDAQYGLHNAFNNISFLAAQLGVGGPWQIAITAAGILVMQFKDSVNKAFTDITNQLKGYIEITKDLGPAAKRLEELKDRAKELEKAKYGSPESQREYNRNLTEQTILEDRIAAAKRAQADWDAAMKATPDAEARRQAFAEEFGGEEGINAMQATLDAARAGTVGAQNQVRQRTNRRRDEIRRERESLMTQLAQAEDPGTMLVITNKLKKLDNEERGLQPDQDRAINALLQGAESRVQGVWARAGQGDAKGSAELAGMLAGTPFEAAGNAVADALRRRKIAEQMERDESIQRGNLEALHRRARQLQQEEDERDVYEGDPTIDEPERSGRRTAASLRKHEARTRDQLVKAATPAVAPYVSQVLAAGMQPGRAAGQVSAFLGRRGADPAFVEDAAKEIVRAVQEQLQSQRMAVGALGAAPLAGRMQQFGMAPQAAMTEAQAVMAELQQTQQQWQQLMALMRQALATNNRAMQAQLGEQMGEVRARQFSLLPRLR